MTTTCVFDESNWKDNPFVYRLPNGTEAVTGYAYPEGCVGSECVCVPATSSCSLTAVPRTADGSHFLCCELTGTAAKTVGTW